MKAALAIISVILLATVSIQVYMYLKAPKAAYVDTLRLYESFSMRQELQGELDKTSGARKKILDSLSLNIKWLKAELETNNYKKPGGMEQYSKMMEEYRLKQEQFEKENTLMAQKYTEQVWTQINQYMKDYGQMKNYQYIYGANGQGNLMYADESANITEELISYINNRYSGK
jgi:outer membrane protein